MDASRQLLKAPGIQLRMQWQSCIARITKPDMDLDRRLFLNWSEAYSRIFEGEAGMPESIQNSIDTFNNLIVQGIYFDTDALGDHVEEIPEIRETLPAELSESAFKKEQTNTVTPRDSVVKKGLPGQIKEEISYLNFPEPSATRQALPGLASIELSGTDMVTENLTVPANEMAISKQANPINVNNQDTYLPTYNEKKLEDKSIQKAQENKTRIAHKGKAAPLFDTNDLSTFISPEPLFEPKAIVKTVIRETENFVDPAKLFQPKSKAGIPTTQPTAWENMPSINGLQQLGTWLAENTFPVAAFSENISESRQVTKRRQSIDKTEIGFDPDIDNESPPHEFFPGPGEKSKPFCTEKISIWPEDINEPGIFFRQPGSLEADNDQLFRELAERLNREYHRFYGP